MKKRVKDIKNNITLRSEIRRADIDNMIRWVGNRRVTEFLNEYEFAGDELADLRDSVPEPLFTLHFNRNGIFFLICRGDGSSVGFIRFERLSGDRYETVYAVGEEELWGRGIGKQALAEALEILFFRERARAIVARIHPGNVRSAGMAERCGLRRVPSDGETPLFAITESDYLALRRA